MTLAAHNVDPGFRADATRRTGVHTNALTRLDSSIDTLATLLKADGVLARELSSAHIRHSTALAFGLARADSASAADHVPLARSASFHVAERSAAEVVSYSPATGSCRNSRSLQLRLGWPGSICF